MWLIRGDVVRTARAHPSSGCTTSQQQERRAGTQQSQSKKMSHNGHTGRTSAAFCQMRGSWSSELPGEDRQEANLDCECFVNVSSQMITQLLNAPEAS